MSTEKELHFRHACKIVLKLLIEDIKSDLEKKSKKNKMFVWVRKWLLEKNILEHPISF